MNAIDITKFCAPDDIREICKAPFSKGGHTYATNGRIVVRVPRIGGVPENWSPSMDRIFTEFARHDKQHEPMVPIPHYRTPDAQVCTVCSGTGKITICPECGGKGAVTLANDYSSYEETCATCDGDGKISAGDGVPCTYCSGTGMRPGDLRVRIGAAFVDHQLLNLIIDLPDAVIERAPSRYSLMYFCFSGGDGLVMPGCP